MRLNVRLFATLKERAGTNQLAVEISDRSPTVGILLEQLAYEQPALAESLKTVIVAVNHEFAFADQSLGANDEVALFPPVSGG